MVLHAIKNHVHLQNPLALIFPATFIFKITSPMNASDGSFFKSFKMFAARALSDIKHSSCALENT